MFTTTTLFVKSESFSDSPSNVCNFASRTPSGSATNAVGGALLGTFGGTILFGLFGAFEFAVDATFGSSFELQLAKLNAPTSPRPMSVRTTRPVVQKPFRSALFDELSDDSIYYLLLHRGGGYTKRRNSVQVATNNRIFTGHQRNARTQ